MHAVGGTRGRTAQAGIAAILLLVILVMGSLYALLSGVNTATAELQQKRDDATTAALKQAKEALIAWSAMRASGPGHLLCPDDNDDGIADTITCGTAATRVGRLPWRTLGLPDLRDANGERLWYAVSRCFLERAPDGFCGNYAVNSDAQGQLAVTGLLQASGVVAIIFAPGSATARTAGGQQARSAANVNDVTHYLEGENANAPATAFEDLVTSTDRFELRRRCERADCPGGAFNDQLIVITHADLFDAVENVVAKRLATEIAPRIQEYVAAWGIHPFAAPFDDLTPAPSSVGPPTTPDRPQSMYWGRDGQINGLLPVAYYDAVWTKDLSNGWVAWNPGAFSIVKTNPLDPGNFVAAPSCNWVVVVDNPPVGVFDGADEWRWVCSFTYDGGAMNVAILGILNNVARSLALNFPTSAGFAATVNGAPVALPAPSNALQASGNAAVQFNLALPDPATLVPAPGGPVPVTITFAAPRFSPVVDPAGTLGWFARNQWYRLAYYSVADGCRLGGVGGCTPAVTVQGAGGPAAARSVLVLAGRNLAGGARPWAVASYFEGENASSPTFNEPDPAPPSFTVFARQLRSPIFNDKVAVVTP